MFMAACHKIKIRRSLAPCFTMSRIAGVRNARYASCYAGTLMARQVISEEASRDHDKGVFAAADVGMKPAFVACHVPRRVGHNRAPNSWPV